MKAFANLRQMPIFFSATLSLWLSACGGLTPQNQSANLPYDRDTNTLVAQKPSPTPQPAILVEITPNPTPEIANSAPNSDLPNNIAVTEQEKLIIPVAGIRREQLQDTFKDSRSQGRVHDAIDIIAARGTPVLATGDGEIARFFDSERGGITIYQYSRDKKMIYYYAHLDRRADNLRAGDFVRQGTVIGYVGDTGNSGAGNYHLHFAIWTITDPKRFWEGPNLNPYLLFR